MRAHSCYLTTCKGTSKEFVHRLFESTAGAGKSVWAKKGAEGFHARNPWNLEPQPQNETHHFATGPDN